MTERSEGIHNAGPSSGLRREGPTASRSGLTPVERLARREAIAYTLMLYELDWQGDWPETHVRLALSQREAKHSGDCTNQTWTCARCMCDDVYTRADAISAALEKLP
jgi:hypothetical protein